MTSSGPYATLRTNCATASPGRAAIFDYETASRAPTAAVSEGAMRPSARLAPSGWPPRAQPACGGQASRQFRALQGLPLWLDETRPAAASPSPVGAGFMPAHRATTRVAPTICPGGQPPIRVPPLGFAPLGFAPLGYARDRRGKQGKQGVPLQSGPGGRPPIRVPQGKQGSPLQSLWCLPSVPRRMTWRRIQRMP
jgi:hypothetical protein